MEQAGEVPSDIGGNQHTPPQKNSHRPRKPRNKRAPPLSAETEHAGEDGYNLTEIAISCQEK